MGDIGILSSLDSHKLCAGLQAQEEQESPQEQEPSQTAQPQQEPQLAEYV